MSVEISIEYQGNLRCKSTHCPSNMTLETDAPVDNGGKGEFFSPTDLVASAFGSCIMTIMGLFAQRSGINLEGTKISVAKEMAAAPLRRIANLKTTVQFPSGLKLSDRDRKKLETAVNMCPVKQSLHPDVKIETQFIY
jgi:putative redox protein